MLSGFQTAVSRFQTEFVSFSGSNCRVSRQNPPLPLIERGHFGADLIVDFKQTEPSAAILKLTDGLGVDSAIEALGSQATFEACVKSTRPGGTISNIGYHGHGDTVNIPRLEWGVGMAEKTIRTGLCPGGAERMSGSCVCYDEEDRSLASDDASLPLR